MWSKTRTLRASLLSCVAVGAVALFLAACGSQTSGGPPAATTLPPTGGGGGNTRTLALALDKATIVAAAGQAACTATVSDGTGAALSGVEVTLGTSFGTLSLGETSGKLVTGTTDAAGKVTATLRSDTIGSALVTASAADVSAVSRSVLVVAGPAARLDFVPATPAILRANETDESVLSVRYLDANANLVTKPNPSAADGQMDVTFTTDLGTLWDPIDTGNSGNGLRTLTVHTDNGSAQVRLRAGRTGGTATVKADGRSQGMDGNLFQPQATVLIVKDPTLVIVADTPSLFAGVTRANVTATLLNGSDQPVPVGTSVTFTTTRGHFTATGTAETTRLTDKDGLVSVTLEGDPSDPGSALLVASATVGGKAVSSAPLQVTVVGPFRRLKIEPLTAQARANGSDRLDFTASCYDAANNFTSKPNLDPTSTDNQVSLDFQTTQGTFISALPAATVNGKATVTLKAPSAPGDGLVSVSAPGVAPVQASVQFTKDVPSLLESFGFSLTSQQVVADGQSRTRLNAQALLAAGAPADNVPVEFSTDAGELYDAAGIKFPGTANRGTVFTGKDGKAYAYLQSSKHAGRATLTASAEAFQSQQEVVFAPGPAANVALMVTPATLPADGVSQARVEVRVTDANDNLTDTVVMIEPPALGLGKVSETQVVTSGGIGSFVYTAGTTGGTVPFRARLASDTAVVAPAQISLVQTVGSVAVTADAAQIVADGMTWANLLVEVKDTLGQAMGGVPVSLGSTMGVLSATQVTTQANGQVSLKLTSTATLGNATVTASAGGKTGTVDVSFVAGPAKDITLTAVPNNLTADGAMKSTVRVEVRDAARNPVDTTLKLDVLAGTPLVVSTDGSVDKATVQTVGGIGQFTYTAGQVPDTVTLRATAPDGTTHGDALVTLIRAAIGSVAVTTDAAQIVANGATKANLTVEVKDGLGQAMSGVVVSLSSTLGALSSAQVTTGANGQGAVTLTSTVTLGKATVTAASGGKTGTVDVAFVAGPVDTVALIATPNNLTADGVTKSVVQVEVRDLQKNPVDTALRVEVVPIVGAPANTSGSVDKASLPTAGGTASFTYTAGTSTGAVQLKVTTADNQSGTVTVTLIRAAIGSVAVTTDAAQIVANGATKANLTVEVKDGLGQAMSGVVVSLSSTLGALSSAQVTTGANGQGAVTLTSTVTLGKATVTAASGGKTGTVDVAFVAGPVDTVALIATPNNLTADGVMKSVVQVEVRDLQKNPVDTALRVEVVPIVGAPANTSGSVDKASLPTVGGTASFTYTAGTSTGAVQLKVTTADNQSGTVTVTLIRAAIGSVAVTTDAAQIVANGATKANLTVEVKDGLGQAMSGVVVSLSSTLGALSSAQVTTGANGQGAVTLTSTVTLGKATVTAASGGKTGTVDVAFVAGPVDTVALIATPNNLTADGVMKSVVQVEVRDLQKNPVDTALRVEVVPIVGAPANTSGSVDKASLPTVGGTASFTYTAGTSTGAVQLKVTTADNQSGTVTVTLIRAAIGSVVLSSDRTQVLADGVSQAALTVEVRDALGQPMSGVVVSLASTLGTLSTAQVTTQATGQASLKLTSTATLGKATVTAAAGGKTGSVDVSFAGGPAKDILLTAVPNNLTADGAMKSVVRVEVRDAVRNPVDATLKLDILSGTPLAVSTNGTLDKVTVQTVGGIGQFTYTAGQATGAVTLRATAPDGTTFGDAPVTLIAAAIGSVVVSADATQIVADGSSFATVTIAVKDTLGQPVAAAPVSLSSTLGALSSAQVATGANGQATVRLTSVATLGKATVTATAGGKTNSVDVSFTAGPAKDITLTAVPNNLTADGVMKSTVRVEVRDVARNPVDTTLKVDVMSGIPLALSANGSLDKVTVQTVGGIGQFTYTAGQVPETVTLRATAPDGATTGDTQVTLIAAVIGTLKLATDRTSIPADGTSRAVLLVNAQSAAAQPVAGALVDLATTFGTLEDFEGHPLLANQVTTDGQGNATAYLRSGVNLGTAAVAATAGGVGALPVNVAFVPGPPAAILLGASRTSLVADGVQTSLIRGVVLDGQNHRVADTQVSLDVQSDPSGLQPGKLSAYAATTSQGEISVTYTAPQFQATYVRDGITVIAGDATAGPLYIALSQEAVGAIDLKVGKDTLTADNSSTTTVTATVTNALGSPAADGTAVQFAATDGAGSFLPGGLVTTVGGKAVATFQAGTRAGPVLITATAPGGITQSVPLTLTAGVAAVLRVLPNLSRIPSDQKTFSELAIYVTDAYGNPSLDTATVTVFSTLGTLWLNTSPGQEVKSVPILNGEGYVNLWSSRAGTANVSVGTEKLSAHASVEIGTAADGQPTSILVDLPKDASGSTLDSVSVVGAGENDEANLDVTVVDSSGRTINDSCVGPVLDPTCPAGSPDHNLEAFIFAGPNGGETLNGLPATRGAPLKLTTKDGRIVIGFRSGRLPGAVTIQIQAVALQPDGTYLPVVTATAPRVTILSGPPFNVGLNVWNSQWISDSSGVLCRTLYSLASDQYGNAVPNDTPVYFGLVDNVKASGANGGAVDGSSTFTSVGAAFDAAGVIQGDTLLLLDGFNAGGYAVDAVAADALTLFSTLYTQDRAPETGVRYAVGNSLGGGVITSVAAAGASWLDCAGRPGASQPGMAVAKVYYPGTRIGDSAYVYAYAPSILPRDPVDPTVTVSRRVGAVTTMGYTGFAPAQVGLAYSGAVQHGSTLHFIARVTDSASPTPFPIHGVSVILSAVDLTTGDVFLYADPGTDPGLVTDSNGYVTYAWTIPLAAVGRTLTVTARLLDGTTNVKPVTLGPIP